MKRFRFLSFALILCLCLVFVSETYSAKPPPQPPATIFYYGYAMLDDSASYKIVSDTRGQYIDKHFSSLPLKKRRGDRIEVQLTYKKESNSYELTWFICFLGRPCPIYNSDRRARIKLDFLSEDVDNISNSATIADMLAYKNTDNPPDNPFPFDPRGPLTDDSVSLLVEKAWGSTSGNNIWMAFLVDKTNDATDPDAITQTKLKEHDNLASYYWTNRNGAACEGIVDEDQIVFFLFDNQLEDQIDFKPVGWETQSGVEVPIKWEVTPKISNPVISVKPIVESQFDACVLPLDITGQELYQIPNGLPFKLTVSKYPLLVGAPPRQLDTIIDTWGIMKQR